MAMTKIEKQAKEEVLNILREEGYPTYARLLNMFDINLTADPGVVGYMEPSKGRIVLNRGLDIEQVSVIARHEILHEYLTHEMRLLKHLAQQTGLDYDTLDDAKIKDLKKDLYKNNVFNIAADYEISNRGYTDADKETVRNIQLNGQTLSGLVTEDEHPDWTNLSVEDMYDKLTELRQQEKQQMQPQDSGGSTNDSAGEGEQQSQSGGSASPRIGDKGDSRTQEAEDIARRAEEIADEAEEAQEQSDNSGSGSSSSSSTGDESGESDDSSASSSSGESGSDESGSESSSGSSDTSNDMEDELSDLQDTAEKIADAAQDLADEMKQTDAESQASDNVFDTPEERKKKAAEDAKLQKIKKMFSDLETQSEILSETQEAVRKEQRIKADKKASQYRQNPLQAFKLSLEGFIKNQIAVTKGSSWSKINKTYAHSGVLKPGRTRLAQGKIPVINVYFDQSGSWDESDIVIGQQAISTLNKYVRQGEIQINVFYFSNNVHGNPEEARREGGTDLDPVIRHINSTKPDNVIVMTDDDGDWTSYSSSVTVPGAVWFLWRNDVSEKLKQHLKGKQLTKSFELK